MQKIWQNKNMGYYRLFIWIYVIGFGMGVLFANFAFDKRMESIDVLSIDVIKNSVYNMVQAKDVFLYLLVKRGKILVCYALVGITILGVPFVWGGIAWAGFLFGMLATMFILQLGLQGSLIFALCLLPQMLLYFPASIGICLNVYQMSLKCWGKGEEEMKMKYYIGKIILFAFVILAGILAEAYVSPTILKRFM